MALMGVVAVVALLGFGLASKDEGSTTLGEPAPAPTLPCLEGSPCPTGTGEGSIADYRGRWVLVNVWASWCDPCRDESPALEDYWREHRRDGLTVLGIDSEDLSDDAREFVREFGLTYPMLRDGEGAARDEFAMSGFPESFLVDPDGNMALVRRGPVTTEYLNEQVTPVIEGGSA